MSENRTFTIIFSRMELNWLFRQLQSGKDRAEGIIKKYSGHVINMNPLTDEERSELAQAETHFQELDKILYGQGTPEQKLLLKQNKLPPELEGKVSLGIKDRLDDGEKERLELVNLRKDLEEALELVEEDSAKAEAIKRMDELPKEEPYRVQFDRTTCKFTLRLIEKDLQKFREHIIPNYEKSEVSEFTDPIMTKSYWVNKAKRSKGILDGLKTKLEKAL